MTPVLLRLLSSAPPLGFRSSIRKDLCASGDAVGSSGMRSCKGHREQVRGRHEIEVIGASSAVAVTRAWVPTEQLCNW